MDTKHTPAPWIVGADCVRGDHDKDGWTEVARSPCPHSPVRSARRLQWERDARLIAAAPELLEALKKARNQVVAFALDTLSAEQATAQVAYIDAAIAKATGADQ